MWPIVGCPALEFPSYLGLQNFWATVGSQVFDVFEPSKISGHSWQSNFPIFPFTWLGPSGFFWSMVGSPVLEFPGTSVFKKLGPYMVGSPALEPLTWAFKNV